MRVSWSVYELFSQAIIGYIIWEYLGKSMNFSATHIWLHSMRVSRSVYELFSQATFGYIRWGYLRQSMNFSAKPHLVTVHESIMVNLRTFQPSHIWVHSMRVSWSVYELFSQATFGYIRWEYLGQSMSFSAKPHLVTFDESILVSPWTFQPSHIWLHSMRVSWSVYELFSQAIFGYFPCEYLGQSMNFSAKPYLVIFDESILAQVFNLDFVFLKSLSALSFYIIVISPLASFSHRLASMVFYWWQ